MVFPSSGGDILMMLWRRMRLGWVCGARFISSSASIQLLLRFGFGSSSILIYLLVDKALSDMQVALLHCLIRFVLQ